MNPGMWTFSIDHRIVFGIKPNETVATATSVTLTNGGTSNGTSSSKSAMAKNAGMRLTDEGGSTVSFTSGDILHLDFGKDGISSGGEDGESLLFGVMLDKIDDAQAVDGGDYLIPSAGEAYDMTKEDVITSYDVVLEDIPDGTYEVTPIFWYDEDDDQDFAGDGDWEELDLPDDINIPNIKIISEEDPTSVKSVQAKQNVTLTENKFLKNASVYIKKDSRQYEADGEEIK